MIVLTKELKNLKSPYALNRARKTVTECIENALQSGCSQLPKGSELAIRSKVSYPTMNKAIAEAAAKGLIVSCGRLGTHVVSLLAQPPDKKQLKSSSARHPGTSEQWQIVKQHIQQGILNNRYRRGERLPVMKAFRQELGISERPVRKALHNLVKTGVLQRYGRGFCPSTTDRPVSSGSIVLICVGQPGGQIRLNTQWAWLGVPHLQQLCTSRNIRLKLVPLIWVGNKLSPDEKAAEIFTDPVKKGVLGFIYIDIATPMYDPYALLKKLAISGCPVMIFDGDHRIGSVLDGVPRQLAKVFTLDKDYEAGRKVGLYLCARGVKSVAYITCYEDTWSRERLRGLQEQLSHEGLEDKIDIYNASLGGDSGKEEVSRKLLQVVEYIETTFNPLQSSIPGICHWRISEPIGMLGLPLLNVIFTRDQIFRKLFPLLPSIIEKNYHYWVCANDDIASACIDYMLGNHFANAHRPCIIGFDNSPTSFMQQFTSYEFNLVAALNEMVEAILNPVSHQSLFDTTFVKIEGSVVER